MKHRSIGKMFALEIVTFGIYRLYWFIKTRRELMSRTGVKIPSPFLLFAPLIIFVAAFIYIVIFSAVSTHNIMVKRDNCITQRGYSNFTSSDSYGAVRTSDPGLENALTTCSNENRPSFSQSIVPNLVMLVAVLPYLPILAWWFWHYCLAIEQVTNEKVSRVLGMILFLVVPDGIDILIVQDYFNKVPEAQGAVT